MPNDEPEYEKRAAERLVFFSDAVVAIAITLLAIDLPVPTGATVAAFWSSARRSDGLYLAFLVSFLIIAGAWTRHHDAFKYVIRSDTWLRNLNLAWLLTIILIPFATKLLTGYGPNTAGVHALHYGFYALLQVGTSGSLLAMERRLTSHDLQAPDGRRKAAGDSYWVSYGVILGFGLSIPVFFVTGWAWALWIAGPALGAQLDRLRRRSRTASPDGTRPEP